MRLEAPNHDRLKQHLSAFSNIPGGGYLVFGIGDAGNIVGINDAKKYHHYNGNAVP